MISYTEAQYSSALSYGCNIIAYDCKGGPKEVLDYGKYGKLIEYGNIDELTETLNNLDIINYKGLKERSLMFTSENITSKYKEKFIEILN